MPRDWSDTDRALFGIDVELNIQIPLLGKAQCFAQLRKQLELEKSNLETLHASSEIRVHKRELFKGNIEQLIKGKILASILLPLLHRDTSDKTENPGPISHAPIDLLILCCYKLGEKEWRRIEAHGLTEVFADLVKTTIKSCAMLPAVMGKFIAMIKDVCDDSENGRILSGLCDTYSLYSSQQHLIVIQTSASNHVLLPR
jgi:hypothetical protein